MHKYSTAADDALRHAHGKFKNSQDICKYVRDNATLPNKYTEKHMLQHLEMLRKKQKSTNSRSRVTTTPKTTSSKKSKLKRNKTSQSTLISPTSSTSKRKRRSGKELVNSLMTSVNINTQNSNKSSLRSSQSPLVTGHNISQSTETETETDADDALYKSLNYLSSQEKINNTMVTPTNSALNRSTFSSGFNNRNMTDSPINRSASAAAAAVASSSSSTSRINNRLNKNFNALFPEDGMNRRRDSLSFKNKSDSPLNKRSDRPLIDISAPIDSPLNKRTRVSQISNEMTTPVDTTFINRRTADSSGFNIRNTSPHASRIKINTASPVSINKRLDHAMDNAVITPQIEESNNSVKVKHRVISSSTNNNNTSSSIQSRMLQRLKTDMIYDNVRTPTNSSTANRRRADSSGFNDRNDSTCSRKRIISPNSSHRNTSALKKLESEFNDDDDDSQPSISSPQARNAAIDDAFDSSIHSSKRRKTAKRSSFESPCLDSPASHSIGHEIFMNSKSVGSLSQSSLGLGVVSDNDQDKSDVVTEPAVFQPSPPNKKSSRNKDKAMLQSESANKNIREDEQKQISASDMDTPTTRTQHNDTQLPTQGHTPIEDEDIPMLPFDGSVSSNGNDSSVDCNINDVDDDANDDDTKVSSNLISSRCCYDQVMSQLSSNYFSASDKIVGLQEQVGDLHGLLNNSLRAGINTSMLLVGPHGSGKSLVLQHVLDSLQKGSNSRKFMPIFLNGSIHVNDVLTLKEITRQISHGKVWSDMLATAKKSDNVKLLKSSRSVNLFGAHLKFLLDVLREGSLRLNIGILFIIDQFDHYTRQNKQTLLYNLLEMTQSNMSHMVIIGLTTRLDVVEYMEKRIQSRFDNRQVLFSTPSFDDLKSILKSKLKIASSKNNISTSIVSEWNQNIDTVFDFNSEMDKELKRCYDLGYSIGWFVSMLRCAISKSMQQNHFFHLTNATDAVLESSHVKNAIRSLTFDTTYSILKQLSLIELILIVAMVKLEKKEQMEYNYQTVYDRIKTFFRLSDSSAVKMLNFDSKVGYKSFQHLLHLKCISLCNNDSNKGINNSSIYMNEFKKVRLLIDPEIFQEMLSTGEVKLTTAIQKWATLETT